jgi:outer membrane lipoprotein-sorting protein
MHGTGVAKASPLQDTLCIIQDRSFQGGGQLKSASKAVSLGVLLGISALASAQLPKSGYIERIETNKNVGASSMQTIKMYWEGDRQRTERYTVRGVIVQIQSGQAFYLYDPAQNRALKTTVPANEAKSVQEMLKEMTTPPKDGKKVGKAKVRAFDCDVYSVSMPKAAKGHGAKVYVSKDKRFSAVMKIELTAGPKSDTMEVRAMKLNYNVPDTMFALPKGVKVEEKKFEPLPKGQPKLPKKSR